MKGSSKNSLSEVERLRGCVNDLVAVLALPALWVGAEPRQIVRVLLDTLLRLLHLDFACAKWHAQDGTIPVELLHVDPSIRQHPSWSEIAHELLLKLKNAEISRPVKMKSPWGGVDLVIVPIPLGLIHLSDFLVVGCPRVDFPTETERLVLNVAVNQATIGLHEASLLSEQKRVSLQLDQMVGRRTQELTAANEELKREIIERKNAEVKQRRSEAYLAQAQRLTLTGSFSWNLANDAISWSDEAYRIWGLERTAEPSFDFMRRRIHPDDLAFFNDVIEEGRSEGRVSEFELRLLGPDGSIKHIQIVRHAVRDEAGRPTEFVGAVRNVTERKKAEEALQEAHAQLAHVTRIATMGELTASIAHELNQPLSGVVTNANACLRWLAADQPNVEETREAVHRIIRDGRRAADVIVRLRALFKKTGTVKEPVNLDELIEDVLLLTRNEVRRQNVKLRLELDGNLLPVMVDRVQIQQVFFNLVLNSIEAMSGVVTHSRELLIRTRREAGASLLVEVKDSGTGLDAKTKGKIFEAFYTTKNGGMGMGLSISRSIIENHGGRLWAISNDGPGATFLFTLPIAT